MSSTTPLIYFDHAATTPTDPEVVTAMLPYFTELYGNPSSIYQFAQKRSRGDRSSPRRYGEYFTVLSARYSFTSSGTESNNLALFGIARGYAKHGKHIITTKLSTILL